MGTLALDDGAARRHFDVAIAAPRGVGRHSERAARGRAPGAARPGRTPRVRSSGSAQWRSHCASTATGTSSGRPAPRAAWRRGLRRRASLAARDPRPKARPWWSTTCQRDAATGPAGRLVGERGAPCAHRHPLVGRHHRRPGRPVRFWKEVLQPAKRGRRRGASPSASTCEGRRWSATGSGVTRVGAPAAAASPRRPRGAQRRRADGSSKALACGLWRSGAPPRSSRALHHRPRAPVEAQPEAHAPSRAGSTTTWASRAPTCA